LIVLRLLIAVIKPCWFALQLRDGQLKKARQILSVSSLSLMSILVFAEANNSEFTISKNTVDNGGGELSGEGFTLTGTMGQPDARRQQSMGGGFSLSGGFWGQGSDLVFKNGFDH